ncbi:glycosyltransferase family 4 protein, partial [Burkholderia vietnamiensis]|uniref:glycosyltransferase family 4 protein n=1 Tax=Burkholderia vietnamiensis TaxID=60552 RepID=UPI0015945F9D
VPGCVDTAQFDLPITQAEARRKLQLPQGRPIVLAVRRLVRRMGLEDLIDAAGLGEHVKLLGFVPDEHLAALYRAATVSVVPTVALEGFGLITVESLASGTPVLVTPVGGLPEAVSGLSEELVLGGTGTAAIAQGLDGALSGTLKL